MESVALQCPERAKSKTPTAQERELQRDFDRLTELAAALSDAPLAFLSVIDPEHHHCTSAFGATSCPLRHKAGCCSLGELGMGGVDIPDLAHDPRAVAILATRTMSGLHMYSGIELRASDGRKIGHLCVLDQRSRTMSARQRSLLTGVAQQTMALMELHARERALGAELRLMEAVAAIDSLTSLLNRRTLLERLEQEWQRARRFSTPLSVVMLDLDHFKAVNDTFGHVAGDEVLRTVGEVIATGIRSVDIAGRFGGEEFCLVLPSTGLAGAFACAESLRQRIQGQPANVRGKQIAVTASLGVAELDVTLMTNSQHLLEAADAALYRAKRAGRNQVLGAQAQPKNATS